MHKIAKEAPARQPITLYEDLEIPKPHESDCVEMVCEEWLKADNTKGGKGNISCRLIERFET